MRLNNFSQTRDIVRRNGNTNKGALKRFLPVRLVGKGRCMNTLRLVMGLAGLQICSEERGRCLGICRGFQ